MSFSERLWKVRDEAGISQERLAEELNVSRQAVAKWESGAGMPDIDNLVGISNFFQVTLDYLLKDTVCPKMKSESDYGSSEIIDFIVEAKKKTYASANSFDAARVASTRLASSDLAYEAGDFKYWDTYVGGSHFSGTEVVWYKEVPVWAMNYSGRTLSGDLGSFLTDSLSRVNAEMPYRGPAFYRDGKYTYVNLVTGEFGWFNGVEKIYYDGELIYELVYHGGMVR